VKRSVRARRPEARCRIRLSVARDRLAADSVARPPRVSRPTYKRTRPRSKRRDRIRRDRASFHGARAGRGRIDPQRTDAHRTRRVQIRVEDDAVISRPHVAKVCERPGATGPLRLRPFVVFRRRRIAAHHAFRKSIESGRVAQFRHGETARRHAADRRRARFVRVCPGARVTRAGGQNLDAPVSRPSFARFAAETLRAADDLVAAALDDERDLRSRVGHAAPCFRSACARPAAAPSKVPESADLRKERQDVEDLVCAKAVRRGSDGEEQRGAGSIAHAQRDRRHDRP
jgi:hypothetical protein